ncbi:MAG: ribosome small subunit-dependent GTPase A [Bacteroidota bacterium]|jgi:ribosome biogenesis GTPase
MKLELLGWNSFFETRFTPYLGKGLLPGRISIQHKDRYVLLSEQGEVNAKVSGKFRFDVSGLQEFPAVGDWVVYEIDSGDQSAVIHHVLERRSKFSRKVAGDRPDEQVLAANIDFIFLVMGLDGNYNLRRLERYLTVAEESEARSVIVLNKSDLCSHLEECTQEVLSIAHSVDVVVMSALRAEDVAPLHLLLTPGITGVLLGSSGVGKSTITNQLLGMEHSKVQTVRETDSHGRHTTPHRELLVLPNGGIIIDTPGLRELQLWSGEEGVQDSFDDIEELAVNCRFRDCKHEAEPNCAVKQALEDGLLDPGRYEGFQKLQHESHFQTTKYDKNLQQQKKERDKKIAKQINDKFRNRDKP